MYHMIKKNGENTIIHTYIRIIQSKSNFIYTYYYGVTNTDIIVKTHTCIVPYIHKSKKATGFVRS